MKRKRSLNQVAKTLKAFPLVEFRYGLLVVLIEDPEGNLVSSPSPSCFIQGNTSDYYAHTVPGVPGAKLKEIRYGGSTGLLLTSIRLGNVELLPYDLYRREGTGGLPLLPGFRYSLGSLSQPRLFDEETHLTIGVRNLARASLMFQFLPWTPTKEVRP